jgi:UDP:flavonoid glycosyltransferase YjiC (YdhE family)
LSRAGQDAPAAGSDAAAADGRALQVLIGAFGDPGHAFPAIALGRKLTERGHEVAVQTWSKWREHVERERMEFHAAPEYQVFPTRERPLRPYEAVVRAVGETRPLVAELKPDVVVSDILTLAPALAAELEQRPWATLVPHVYPPPDPDVPPFGLGAMPPRGALGKAGWRMLSGVMQAGLERGRRELNGTRERVGLPPLPHPHGGISPQLCMVATFPQLEYPRTWPSSVYVTGPLAWEPPSDDVELPEGSGPLVLVAPSTSQDRGLDLVRTALRALAPLPVRVLATSNRPIARRPAVPPNAKLVEWLSYSRTMPHADLVVCHGGHGTLMRALANGVPVVSVPAAGDMAENASRVQWAGAGLSLPKRLLSALSLRLVVERVLGDGRYRDRARALSRWAHDNDGAVRAAELVESFARERRLST